MYSKIEVNFIRDVRNKQTGKLVTTIQCDNVSFFEQNGILWGICVDCNDGDILVDYGTFRADSISEMYTVKFPIPISQN